MKKTALNWAGRALAVAAAGCTAGVFLPGSIGGRIGCAVLAVICAAAAWRCWNLASGRTAPVAKAEPAEHRPWER